jgi:hypothetical protein
MKDEIPVSNSLLYKIRRGRHCIGLHLYLMLRREVIGVDRIHV